MLSANTEFHFFFFLQWSELVVLCWIAVVRVTSFSCSWSQRKSIQSFKIEYAFLGRSSLWEWESFPLFSVYSRIGFFVLFYHECVLSFVKCLFLNQLVYRRLHWLSFQYWTSFADLDYIPHKMSWEVTLLLFSRRQYKRILWKFCKIFQWNHMGLEIIFEFLITNSILGLFRFSASSWLRFGGLWFSKNVISSKLSNLSRAVNCIALLKAAESVVTFRFTLDISRSSFC